MNYPVSVTLSGFFVALPSFREIYKEWKLCFVIAEVARIDNNINRITTIDFTDRQDSGALNLPRYSLPLLVFNSSVP